ncbi:hypothetical protein [Cytophaga aurantiaca]|uniref:hypothetical protein n=1 Tax=Cytophaga aurantiaca TaxID=29530 RepID=UPI0003622AAC|nr:hypothetical protein [Cytophaga aurantiaca]
MAACTFDIPFTQNVNEMIKTIQESILKVENAAFEGNSSSGSFSLPTPLGQIKGTYKITATLAHFAIIEKPMLVPCSLIESKLNGFLNASS